MKGQIYEGKKNRNRVSNTYIYFDSVFSPLNSRFVFTLSVSWISIVDNYLDISVAC